MEDILAISLCKWNAHNKDMVPSCYTPSVLKYLPSGEKSVWFRLRHHEKSVCSRAKSEELPGRWPGQIYSGLGSASGGNTEIGIEKESISFCNLNRKGVESGLQVEKKLL